MRRRRAQGAARRGSAAGGVGWCLPVCLSVHPSSVLSPPARPWPLYCLALCSGAALGSNTVFGPPGRPVLSVPSPEGALTVASICFCFRLLEGKGPPPRSLGRPASLVACFPACFFYYYYYYYYFPKRSPVPIPCVMRACYRALGDWVVVPCVCVDDKSCKTDRQTDGRLGGEIRVKGKDASVRRSARLFPPFLFLVVADASVNGAVSVLLGDA